MKKNFLLGLMAMTLPLVTWAQNTFEVTAGQSTYTYIGGTIQPQLEVKAGDVTVSSDKYTVAYTVEGYDDTEVRNVGVYTATVTGKEDYENYSGSVTFKVTKPTTRLVLGTLQTVTEYGNKNAITNPEYYVVSGLQGSDTEANVEITDLSLERVDSKEPMTDVGSYTVTLTGGATRNYNIGISGTSTLKINPKSLHLTVTGNKTYTYGQAVDVNVDGNDYVEGDDKGKVGLTWNYTKDGVKVEEPKNAGTYGIQASITSNNYTVVQSTETITINKKELTITPDADALSIIYGQANPVLNECFTIDGFEYNETAKDIDLTLNTDVTPKDAKSYRVYPYKGTEKVFKADYDKKWENYWIDQNKFDPTKAAYQFNIVAKQLDNSDIEGVEIETSATYQGVNFDATKAGVIALTYGEEKLVAETSYTIEQTTTDVKNAGSTVNVTLTGTGNYTGTKNVELKIDKADLTVKAKDVTVAYGTDPEFGVEYEGLVGDDVDTPANVFGENLPAASVSETTLTPGTYTINVTGISEDGYTNYNVTAETGTLTVTKAGGIKITAEAVTATYGKTLEELAEMLKYEVTGSEDENIWETEPKLKIEYEESDVLGEGEKQGLKVGTYNIVLDGTPKLNEENDANYSFEYEKATLTIGQSRMVITVNDATMNRGGSVPAPTYTVTGLAPWDEVIVEPTFEYQSAGQKVDAAYVRMNRGTYDVVASAAKSANGGSYKTTYYNKGSLTVGKAAALITITGSTKKYGDAEPAAVGTFEVTGFIGDEKLSENTKITLSRVEGEAVGEYAITYTLSQEDPNYDITCLEPAKFTITKAPLTVTALPQTIEFGQKPSLEVSENTVKFETLVNDETVVENTVNVTLSVKEGDIDKVGEYTIIVTATSDNYEITPVEGTLTVTAKGEIVLDRAATGDEAVSTLLEAYNGETVDVVLGGDRNLNADYWYTWVLPFETTVREISNAFGYAIVNVPNTANTNAGVISFKLKVDGQTIPANTLILIKTDQPINLKDAEKPVKFEKKEIKYESNFSTNDVAGNEYHGVYEPSVITENGWWYLSGGTFYNAGEYYEKNGKGVSISPLGGYIIAKAGGAARIYVEEADGSTTAINAVTGETISDAEGWYTVGGVKLNAQPTQKGIYINNGKKVVIK